MLENENLVTEEVTENAEQTAEETQQAVKTYTQEEVNEIVGKAKARTRAKIQKENDRKYGDLVETLKAGTGGNSVEDITSKLRKYYTDNGVTLPQKADYSPKDIEVLARVDAEEFINGGFEEVIEEADRLKALGVENMTAREKALFLALSNHIKTTEESRALAEIGVKEEVYNSREFKEFASQYKSDIPITKIYENFEKMQPKKEFKTMGSMKSSISEDNGIKDYYSFEEASKFTQKEIDENPALFEAIKKSMLKWK